MESMAYYWAAVGALVAAVHGWRRLRPRPIGADTGALTSQRSVQRAIAKKERARAAAVRGATRGQSAGLPDGQTAAKKWIVLDLGLRPAPGAYALDPTDWSLAVRAPGGASVELKMRDIEALGVRRYEGHAWHCVTGWTALGLTFDGVPLTSVLAHPKLSAANGGTAPEWDWLVQRAADGYTVPVAREDAMAADAFLALAFDGQPVPMEHGGPRLVFPALYGWKSAKWVVELELALRYEPGFWERLGCHPRGRVARNERFREGWSAAVWAWLAAAPGVYRRLGGHDVWVFVMQAGGNALGAVVRRFSTLHVAAAPRSASRFRA